MSRVSKGAKQTNFEINFDRTELSMLFLLSHRRAGRTDEDPRGGWPMLQKTSEWASDLLTVWLDNVDFGEVFTLDAPVRMLNLSIWNLAAAGTPLNPKDYRGPLSYMLYSGFLPFSSPDLFSG